MLYFVGKVDIGTYAITKAVLAVWDREVSSHVCAVMCCSASILRA